MTGRSEVVSGRHAEAEVRRAEVAVRRCSGGNTRRETTMARRCSGGGTGRARQRPTVLVRWQWGRGASDGSGAQEGRSTRRCGQGKDFPY
ncbi:hypothetical protein GUJ93_ZPchr0007g5101 [Zizania palustris]|uniref:Uncharacterized protein n=1 Tax=Zizania palustris TaxID=103762 RepID=A0A8J5STT6_ZIZPA|nr:hypothetical protein GUJ93_ZPchr0007g5101 [Zizania palustris]